ncbi:MAG: 6-carboxytetrahydropterin synthase [Bacteroidales bacterium]|nr:6-carboxytetrahydropterin synthase [Bacteroidales bacterium]
MTVLRLTKQFNFEMAHALEGYDGLCKNIHGHTYELFVTVIGEPISDNSSPKDGMLIDFKDLKSLVKERIINQFDHTLVLSNKTSPNLIKELKLQYERIVITEYQPTSENFLIDFVDRIKGGLPEGVKLFSMKFRETVTSYAEWFAKDNE